MLDKIMDMVGDEAINAMTQKAGISTDQAKSVLPLAGESLQEGLISKLTGGGGMDEVLGMFKGFTGGGGDDKNALFGMVKGLFMQKIMNKLGFNESMAGLVSGAGMSSIIGGLASKIKGHGDSDEIDAASVMSVLGGGSGVMGALTGMLGGKKEDGDGGIAGALGDMASGIFGK